MAHHSPFSILIVEINFLFEIPHYSTSNIHSHTSIKVHSCRMQLELTVSVSPHATENLPHIHISILCSSKEHFGKFSLTVTLIKTEEGK
jgi:hypothetical protein